MQNERTIPCDVGILEGVPAHQGRAPHGGPLDGSADPFARSAGRGILRVLPPPGLPNISSPDRWLDRLPRPRTLSEVWQATGLAAKRHHDTASAVFRSAAWEWDDLGIILATDRTSAGAGWAPSPTLARRTPWAASPSNIAARSPTVRPRRSGRHTD